MRPPSVCFACRRLVARPTNASRSFSSVRETSYLRPDGRRWQAPRPMVRGSTRRTFLEIFGKPAREIRTPEIEAGFEKLLEFRNKEVDNTRLPPRDELVKGWQSFFRGKMKSGRSANPLQVSCALHLFRHLKSTQEEGEKLAELLDLRRATEVLLKAPSGKPHWHRRLVREIYQYLAEARGVIETSDAQAIEDFTALAKSMACYDDAVNIRTKLVTFLNGSSSSRSLIPNQAQSTYDLWIIALRGLAREKAEKQLKPLVQDLLRSGLPYSQEVQEIMTSFYAESANGKDLQYWFKKPIDNSASPSPGAYRALLRFASHQPTFPAWVNTIMQDLCNGNPSKHLWDAIMQWAVYQKKNDSEIRGMMDVMNSLNRASGIEPDIETLNWLMQTSIDMGDYFRAERLVDFDLGFDSRPNARTYALQLECRLAAGDETGSAATFERLLLAGDLDEGSNRVINQYVKYLCANTQSGTQRTLEALSLTENRQVLLDPLTVAAVCVCFLKNDQLYDVIDTLSLHVFLFNLTERHVIMSAMMAYCRDRDNTSTARAWDTYSLLRQYFPETSREDRVKLMESFFLRKRGDMAAHVFGHMRAHEDNDIRPDLETYVRCLEGIGHCPDLASLKMVHNMFKMDALVSPNTRLYNALMIGYVGCEKPNQAFSFWADIVNSSEGPTHKTLIAVFKACQIMPYGDEEARKIWKKLHDMDVDIPATVYGAYITTMATHMMMDEVRAGISSMRIATGLAPGDLTLGEAFNALPEPELQAEFQAWAAETYPSAWAHLQKTRLRPSKYGVKKYDVRPMRLTA